MYRTPILKLNKSFSIFRNIFYLVLAALYYVYISLVCRGLIYSVSTLDVVLPLGLLLPGLYITWAVHPDWLRDLVYTGASYSVDTVYIMCYWLFMWGALPANMRYPPMLWCSASWLPELCGSIRCYKSTVI